MPDLPRGREEVADFGFDVPDLPGAPTITRLRPPSGHVTLFSARGDQVTLMIVGDVDRTGGVGGWQQSERYGQPDGDWWRGRPKGALSIPCRLDMRTQPGPTIERRLAVLYRMGQAGDQEQPPAIRLAGDVPRSTGQAWKLDDVAHGARQYRADAPAELAFLEVTLALTELNRVNELQRAPLGRSRNRAGKRRRRSYTVRAGDTLRSIAVRELGSSGQWTTLRDANKTLKKADPDTPLRRGMTIQLQKKD